jgi:hypothetical protein
VRSVFRAALALAAANGLAASAVHAAGVAAFHVSVAQKAELQTLLDRHGAIRLDPNADYRTSKNPVLTMHSGQRVLGGWNTRVPRIIIPGGASNVVVIGVRSDGAPDVELTGGAENDDVEIVGGNSGPGTQIRVRIRDGARVNRLRLVEYGGLDVQQTTSGYVRDSTFTAMLGYWPGPQISWRGNSSEPSRGNALLGVVSLTPGDGSRIENAGDLWLVAWDCESWNGPGTGSPRCFTIDRAPRVVSVSLGGGTAYPKLGGALADIRNVPTVVSWFEHGAGGQIDGADLRLENVGTFLSIQPDVGFRQRDEHAPDGATRVRVLQPSPSDRGARIASNVAALSAADRNALLAIADAALPPSQTKPTRRAIDDALGPSWRDGLSSRPDSSARIQADIDKNGIATLAPGTYYLDRPLKVGSRTRAEGILGDDRDEVYLVAKGDFPLVEGRGDFGGDPRTGEGVVISLVLGGLTLYGGTHGIHLSAEPGNLGRGGVVAWSQFSDLKLMHQRVAGINASGIAGIDENLWYRVDFVDVPIAFRGNGTGASFGMNYADKQHFVDCQFQNVSDTVWYWTTDRPSGGEIWSGNYFANVGRLTQTRAANNLLWTNSVMEDVSGPVALDVTDAGTATYYFMVVDSVWRGRGPAVVTDTQSWQVGTLFVGTELAQSGGSIVANAPEQSVFMWGSRIAGTARLGKVQSGLFIGSSIPHVDGTLQIVDRGRATALHR